MNGSLGLGIDLSLSGKVAAAPSGGLSAVITPASSGWVEDGGGGSNSTTFTVTPSGGVAPYTLLWLVVSSLDDALFLPNDTGLTAIVNTSVPVGENQPSTVWCRVTDAAATVVFSNTVTVT